MDIARQGSYVEQALDSLSDTLNGSDISLHLGDLAESAWDGDGRELLQSFLQALIAMGERDRQVRVFEGLVKLGWDAPTRVKDFIEWQADDEPIHEAASSSSSPEPVAGRRTAGEVPLSPWPSAAPTDEDGATAALDALISFNLLAETTLEKAAYGDSKRRADLAHFEGFRFAAIAAMFDTSIDVNEWHVLFESAKRYRPEGQTSDTIHQLLRAVKELGISAATLGRRSLVLHLARENDVVRATVHDAALELLRTVLAMGAISYGERAVLTTFGRESLLDPKEDRQEQIQQQVMVPMTARSLLRPDPVLIALEEAYERAVPWN